MLKAHTDHQGPPKVRLVVRAWFRLRIHVHAFAHAPRRYLIASWWRLLGKRIRARIQLQSLLGTSPLVYRLWLHHEPRTEADATAACAPAIVALIYDADKTVSEVLQETLSSLAAEEIKAVIVDDDTFRAADAIDWDVRPWLMPIAAGDVLARGAGDAYRRSAVQGARVVYADDDLVDKRGRRHAPHFKPRWNSELFRHFDYLTGTCILRASVQELTAQSGENWAGRLVASIAKAGEVNISHIPRVLHHRSIRSKPNVPSPVEIRGIDWPLVSVIIPTRNRVDLLETCVEGLERTDYPDMEVIIVDNGSDDPKTLAYLKRLDPACYKVIRDSGPFNFSALNNRAVREARGDLLCLLNNDIEVLDPDWLRIMAVQALRPNVGAVGAQLLYPDGRIQHAGVVTGICGGVAHAHRLLRPEDEGYFRRHALPQFVSAVTAACLVMQRTCFEAVGGFDEANFAVAYNDVDLCLRLNEQGWQSFYEPRATLIHHESVSRGFDRDPVGAARLAREFAALQAAWGTRDTVDPYHHPQLSRFSESFVVKL